MDTKHAPEAIHELLRWIEERGFALTFERVDGTANQIASFLSPEGVSLQILCDRGVWLVDVGWGKWGELFDADLWLVCLDGIDVDASESSLEEQVQQIRNRWADIASPSTTRLLRCLRRAQRTRAYRSFGIEDQS